MTWMTRGIASLGLCLGGLLTAAAGEPDAVSVLINLLDQAEVPAREKGVLLSVDAQEGSRVKEGDVLARIDDTEAQFLQQRARLEWEIATKNAANELAVRTAEKTRDVAQAIFKRTNEGAQTFRNSISQTELDRLQLEADKADLAVRQAQHEFEVAKATARLKQVEFEFATRSVERRRITAPFSGMVVEVKRRRGEWVEPGNQLLKLVRLDRLRAEGFLAAQQARPELAGRRVTLAIDPSEKLTQPVTGKIVFVSPEVDPVNGQVRVLAEIENPALALRPGVRATMTISAQPGPTTE